jgi:hypothetical protein
VSTMGRCRSCRWWQEASDKDSAASFNDASLRDPETYEIIDAVRFCRSPALRFSERPADDGAAVVDGSGYYGALMTGPAFGCVNFDGSHVTYT